jgi:hypothetical protein
MWWNQLLVVTCLVVCYHCWIKEVVESSGWQRGRVVSSIFGGLSREFLSCVVRLGWQRLCIRIWTSHSPVQRYKSTLSWSLESFSLYLRFSDTFGCEAHSALSFDIAALKDQNQCGTYNGVYFWWAIHSHQWEMFRELYIKSVKSENPDKSR